METDSFVKNEKEIETIYYMLTISFLKVVRSSGISKYSNSEKIAKNLFYRTRTSLDRSKLKVTPCPHDELANAMLKYYEEVFPDEGSRKDALTKFIKELGEEVAIDYPKISMTYFLQLVKDDENAPYHYLLPGYHRAINTLTRTFYEYSYKGAKFYELLARYDRYKTYKLNDELYEATIKFLTDEEKLPQSVKEYLVKAEGEPAQHVIYNTLIYTMGTGFDEELLIKRVAEIYYYQILLNRKIGRYASPDPDYFLLRCILKEIKMRFLSNPLELLEFDLNEEEEPDLASEKYVKFVDDVMKYYREHFLKQHPTISTMTPEYMLEVIEQYNKTHTNHSIDNLLEYLKKL